MSRFYGARPKGVWLHEWRGERTRMEELMIGQETCDSVRQKRLLRRLVRHSQGHPERQVVFEVF